MGKYVCEKCGSDDVEVKTFVHLITHDFTLLDEIEDEDTWCIECQDHTGVVFKMQPSE